MLACLLQEGGQPLDQEALRLLRMFGVQERFFGRKEQEQKEEVEVYQEQGEHDQNKETEQELEEQEVRPKPGARRMMCKVCNITFQGRPYSEFQVKQK